VLTHAGGELVLPVSGVGEVTVPVPVGAVVSVPGIEPLELRCASCGHTSGEVALVFGFGPEHRGER